MTLLICFLLLTCSQYAATTPSVLPLDTIIGFEFNNLIYKESRYKREKLKQYRLQQNQEDMMLVDEEYETELEKLRSYEQAMLLHLQAVSSCLKKCEFMHPWLSGDSPNFIDWEFKQMNNIQTGSGIVIPILPTLYKAKEIDSIQRLIRVLRAQGNELPIEITYLTTLSPYDKKRIISAARSDSPFPKADIWFVDLQPVVSKDAFNSIFGESNFVYGLSSIYNSFEDAVIMTSKMVPLSNFQVLLQDKTYQDKGILMFRVPNKLEYKPYKFIPGFHEVELLISKLLKVHTPEVGHIFDSDFQKVVDPTLLILNKRNIKGAYLGLTLQFYHKLLRVRFADITDDDLHLSLEYLWIGHLMIGVSNFHQLDAIIVGTESPRENVEQRVATSAKEVCSASWGQHNDHKLIYVTAHQFESWRDDSTNFRTKLQAKFNIKGFKLSSTSNSSRPQENTFDEVWNTDIYAKLALNPLYMDVILEPPRVNAVMHDKHYHEPYQGWIQQEYTSTNEHKYWCGYDFVGNPMKGPRGDLWKIEDDDKQSYELMMHEWFANRAYGFKP